MKKVNIQEVLYLIGYVLIIIPTFFSEVVFFKSFLKPLMYIGMIILLFVYILKVLKIRKFEVKKFLKTLILICLCGISSVTSGTYDMAKLFLIIFAFPFSDFSKFIKIDVTFRVIFIIAVFSCYLFGFTTELTFYRDDKLRYAFGFSQPNQLGLFITMISLELLYFTTRIENKKKYIYLIFVILGLIFNMLFTDSRASIILTLLSLIIFMFRKLLIKTMLQSKGKYFLSSNLFIILSIVSILFIFLYQRNNSIVLWLDELFSSRIKWSEVYFNYYGINMLGNDIYIPYEYVKYNGVVLFCLDNGYIFFILKFGVIFWIIYAYMFKKLYIYLINKKEIFLLTLILLILLYGMMENTAFKYAYNPFLILLGSSVNTKLKEDR